MTNPDPLTSLLLRVRRELWRRRLKRLAGWAFLVSASMLVAAGLVHVLLTPVAVPVGVMMALAGPAVAAAVALWWQWPDLREAAMVLDREGRYDEFFQSAREAGIMAPDMRPAGARILLERARKIAGEVELPAASPAVAPVFSQFRYVPLALLACGLFLLQLPGARTEMRPSSPDQLAGPGAPLPGDRTADVGDLASALMSRSGAPVPAPVVSSSAAEAAVLPAQAPAQNPRDFADSKMASATTVNDTDGDADADAIAAVGDQSAGDENRAPGAAAAKVSEDSAGRSGDSAGGPEPVFQQQVEFVDLARVDAGAIGVVSGSKALEMVSGVDSSEDRTGAATMNAATPPASSWVGYYSHHQRRQIADYFQLIEESP